MDTVKTTSFKLPATLTHNGQWSHTNHCVSLSLKGFGVCPVTCSGLKGCPGLQCVSLLLPTCQPVAHKLSSVHKRLL